MTFYQIRDETTGLWYKKGSNGGLWVAQDEASVWTQPNGPRAALGNITRYRRRARTQYKPEVVSLVVGANVPFVTYVRSDDWRGLYLDGKLVEEGQRVDVADVLQRLGIACEQIYADEQWLAELGSLPEDRSNIKEG
jgi:hypothetical protein